MQTLSWLIQATRPKSSSAAASNRTPPRSLRNSLCNVKFLAHFPTASRPVARYDHFTNYDVLNIFSQILPAKKDGDEHPCLAEQVLEGRISGINRNITSFISIKEDMSALSTNSTVWLIVRRSRTALSRSRFSRLAP